MSINLPDSVRIGLVFPRSQIILDSVSERVNSMNNNLYPVYSGNVRIGTVSAPTLAQATAKANERYGHLPRLRVLTPYLPSIPSWGVPCSTVC